MVLAPVNSPGPAPACTIWTLQDPDALTEDVAFDSATNRYLVTSVTRGGVYAVEPGGHETPLIRPDTATWGTFAIGLDSRRHTLWVTTFSYPGSWRYQSSTAGRAAILEYDYPGGRLRRRWIPDTAARAVGDLAIAPDGDVYVTASIGGGVYRVDRAHHTLRTVLPAHTFHSPQTPVVSRDGKTILVPDYSRGIARVEVASGRVTWLAHEASLDLRVIDGMYALGHDIVAVQNGLDTNRIVRLTLRGDSVTKALLVASGDDAVDLNHAVIVGGEIRFLASSGWARMSDAGVMGHGDAAQAPRLMRAGCAAGLP